MDIIPTTVRTAEQAARLLPSDQSLWQYDPAALERGVLTPSNPVMNLCRYLYFAAAVTWNGDVVPCCRDVHGRHAMGNLLREPMSAIWNNDAYLSFRRSLLDAGPNPGICRLCQGFPIPFPVWKSSAR